MQVQDGPNINTNLDENTILEMEQIQIQFFEMEQIQIQILEMEQIQILGMEQIQMQILEMEQIQKYKNLRWSKPPQEQDILASDKFQLGQVCQFLYFLEL